MAALGGQGSLLQGLEEIDHVPEVSFTGMCRLSEVQPLPQQTHTSPYREKAEEGSTDSCKQSVRRNMMEQELQKNLWFFQTHRL